jgi:carboxylesterase type B
MHRAWVDFISGKPLGAGGQLWPTYSPGQRQTLVFGEQVQVQNDPHSAERQLWEHWAAVSR